MAVWAVIPAKSFLLGKSRLNLPDEQRIAINRHFLEHVLACVTSVLPASHVVLVTRDEAALTIARRAGARCLLEGAHGDLNAALAEGARFAGDRGAEAILSVATDLPDLTADDLRAMLDAFAGNDVVLAPDEQGTGTNAMLMAPNRLPYCHAENSLWRHLEAAREAKLRFKLVRRDGLSRDVDLPGQWHAPSGLDHPWQSQEC